MRDLLEELWEAAAELLPEEEETEAAPSLAPAPVPRGMRRKKIDGEAAAEYASPPAPGVGVAFAAGRRAEGGEAGALPEEVFLPGEEEAWPDSMAEEGEAGVGEGRRFPISGGQTGAAGRKGGQARGETEAAAARPAAALIQAGKAGAHLLQEQARRLRAAAELSRALGSRGQGGMVGGESAGGLSEWLLTGESGPGAVRTVPSAREVDRLFQRDARRYDGAFFLY